MGNGDYLTHPLDQLPDPLPIEPLTRPFDVTIRPPGSKSITNRALLLAALAEGTSTFHGALVDADDAQVMIRALGQLGAKIEIKRAPSASSGTDHVRVTGVGGSWTIPTGKSIHLDLHNAGTATRFLAAAAVLAPADSAGIIIDGDARMRRRPIGELADALARLGVRVEFLGAPGCPPLRIVPPTDARLLRSEVAFDRTASGQFISAMLLIAPFLPNGLRVMCRGELTSPDYVFMTIAMLSKLGARGQPGQDPTAAAQAGLELDWQLHPGGLRGFVLAIEPDASGATYFEAAAAMIPGARVVIPGLPAGPGSWQGDVKFAELFDDIGATFTGDPDSTIEIRGGASLRPFDRDFGDIPDTAMTGAVLACFAAPTPDNPSATSTLRGLRTLRVKETDRLAALKTELSKIGATVEIFKDVSDEGLRITPPPGISTSSLRHSVTPSLLPVHFDTYNDHRMAMSLALVGLRRPNVFIRDPACVRKTYPGFWADFARLYQ